MKFDPLVRSATIQATECSAASSTAADRRSIPASVATDKLAIEFFTQDDPLYILPFFEEFFRHYADTFNVAHVSCSRVMGKRSRKKLIRELFWLYGLAGFVRLTIRAGLARALGTLPRSRNAVHFHSLGQLCHAFGVPFSRIGDPNESTFVAEVERRSPQVIVSVACPYILKEKLLKLPQYGCINIHHAPLPKYKGMMPTFWQMYHGEKRVGVTIHYMVPKVDQGPALLQSQLEIEPGASLDSLIRISKVHGAHCMAKVLRKIQTRQECPVDLEASNGSYFTFPTREQIREFRRRGLRAI